MFGRSGAAGFVLILAFVVLFKFGDAIAGTMSNPFYVTLGFTKVEIASVAKVFGVVATLAGVAIGGVMVLRLGIFRALLIGGVLQMLSNVFYILQVWVGHDVAMLTVTIGVENLTSGIGSAAFVAYLSGLCNVAFTATQYALLSSLATVGVNILSASGGWLADELGWVRFFLLSMVLALPGSGAAVGADAPPAAWPPAQTAKRTSPPPGEGRDRADAARACTAARCRRCDSREPGERRLANAAGPKLRSMKPGLDLLAHQAQRVDDPLLRDLSAAVQFGKDAVEPDLLVDLAQPRREAVGVVDEDLRRHASS